jgi:transposase
MTRKAHLEEHYSCEALKQNYLSSVDKIERRRWHLLWLVREGWTIKQAAEVVGMNYDYARACVKEYNERGAEAVRNKHKGKQGRQAKALLSQSQVKALRQRLQSPPPDGGLWTGPKVAQWIATTTGREKVYPQRGWDYLKKLRHSLKVPRPEHQKGDKAAQALFKQQLSAQVRALQAKYPNATVEVWSFDEHRLGLKPILRRVWTPIGARPIARVCHRYEWLYLYGFVQPNSGQTEWLIAPRVNVLWFNLFLQVFATSVGAGEDKIILLVLDQAGWHMSANVEVPPGIVLAPLPPYSPELQPAERLWSLTDEPLANQSFDSLDALEQVLCHRCQVLSGMRSEIRALTNYHWWPEPELLKSG